jgi:hypothetical protein
MARKPITRETLLGAILDIVMGVALTVGTDCRPQSLTEPIIDRAMRAIPMLKRTAGACSHFGPAAD